MEPIDGINLQAGNKYILMRVSAAPLSRNALKDYLAEAESILSRKEIREAVGSSPVRLEIKAAAGLEGVDENSISGLVNKRSSAIVSEVEVFLPEGGSVAIAGPASEKGGSKGILSLLQGIRIGKKRQ